MTVNKCISVLY